MKLLIIDGCVVKGGKTRSPGDIHDTGDVAPAEDREAYELIASGRALAMNDKDTPAAQERIAEEKKAKAAAKAK